MAETATASVAATTTTTTTLDDEFELDFESIHEKVGHMMHHIARLLPPAPDAPLEAPKRPLPRNAHPLPAFSGVPRHRDQWLQDMMMAFAPPDPATSKGATPAPTPKPTPAAKRYADPAAGIAAGAAAAAAPPLGPSSSSKAQKHVHVPPQPHIGGQATPYAHLFPDISVADSLQPSRKARQQSRLTSNEPSQQKQQQQQRHGSNSPGSGGANRPPSSFARPYRTSYARNQSPQGQQQQQQQKSKSQSPARANRSRSGKNTAEDKNTKTTTAAPAAASSGSGSEPPKPRVVPGSIAVNKKGRGGKPTASSGAAATAAAATTTTSSKDASAQQQKQQQDATTSGRSRTRSRSRSKSAKRQRRDAADEAEQRRIDAASADAAPLPLRDLQDNERMFCYVEFKRRRLRKMPCPQVLPNGSTVECGTYVIVHGDRDWDMGLVIAKTVERFPRQLLAAEARRRRGGHSPGRGGNGGKKGGDDGSVRRGGSNIRAEGFYSTLPLGKRVWAELMDGVEMTEAELNSVRTEAQPVVRLALVEESNLLQNEFTQYEDDAKQLCQLYCDNAGLGIKIDDCELQFDRKKISFFFDSARPCDFRALVKDLFKVFGARIWMENTSDAMRTGELPVPVAKRASNNNNAAANSKNGAAAAATTAAADDSKKKK